MAVAATPALNAPIQALTADGTAGRGKAERSAAAVLAPDTPPAVPPQQLPFSTAGQGMLPRRLSLTSRRCPPTRLPPLVEEGLGSPRRRQSLAAANPLAHHHAGAMPRRHSSTGSAERALHDKALARYVPFAPAAAPKAPEAPPPPARTVMKRPVRDGPPRQRECDNTAMRIALDGFGRAESPEDHRRRRAFKHALTGQVLPDEFADELRGRCSGELEFDTESATGAALFVRERVEHARTCLRSRPGQRAGQGGLLVWCVTCCANQSHMPPTSCQAQRATGTDSQHCAAAQSS
jgi:hypothetical protein